RIPPADRVLPAPRRGSAHDRTDGDGDEIDARRGRRALDEVRLRGSGRPPIRAAEHRRLPGRRRPCGPQPDLERPHGKGPEGGAHLRTAGPLSPWPWTRTIAPASFAFT